MPCKNHNHKWMLLAIGLISPLLFIVGASISAEVYSKEQIQEIAVTKSVNYLRIYQEKVELLLPWFGLLAYTSAILNNGYQLVNQIKKNE